MSTKLRFRVHTLFWKVFLIIWLSQVSLILVTAVLMNLEYEKRFSEYELTERFQPMADIVVSRYEEGIDTAVREGRHGSSLSIVDLEERRLIFGNRFSRTDNRVSWEFQSASGRTYLANVNVPPRVNLLAILDAPYPSLGALATIILFSWLLTLLLTRPIRSLQSHVQSLAEGDLDSRLDSRVLKRKDEIGDLAKALEEMSERIQKLLDSKQRLLYDVSHELRAPLARMQVAAEIVKGQAEERGETTELHDRVGYEIAVLNTIITELLQLARSENGVPPIEVSDLCTPVEEVIEDMQFSWPDRSIELSSSGTALSYAFPVTSLKTACKNILENALKYGDPDKPVQVEIAETANGQKILIRDTGPGIPEDKLESVLQPFTRLQSESVEGFGLGLSIAQRAAAQLGGTIRLRNLATGGLEACLALKLTPAPGDA